MVEDKYRAKIKTPEELMAIGKMQEVAGDRALAEACFRQAIEVASSPQTRRRAYLVLTACFRKRGDHDGLLEMWRRYAAEFPEDNRGYVEMAKVHEHRRKDLPAAKEAAEAAPRRTDSVLIRLDRLQRRLARAPRANP